MNLLYYYLTYFSVLPIFTLLKYFTILPVISSNISVYCDCNIGDIWIKIACHSI